jgi:hypothetical protein
MWPALVVVGAVLGNHLVNLPKGEYECSDRFLQLTDELLSGAITASDRNESILPGRPLADQATIIAAAAFKKLTPPIGASIRRGERNVAFTSIVCDRRPGLDTFDLLIRHRNAQ